MKKKLKHTDFSQLGENITTLMKHCEMDAAALSSETGLPASTISRLRSNTTEFSPNLSSLIPIARYFQISVSQLIGEEALPKDICGTFKPSITRQFIPHFSPNDFPACLKSSIADNPIIEIDLPVSRKTFAITIQGNAMEPQIPDKALVIIDPEISAENKDIVLTIPPGKNIPVLRQLLIDGEEKYLRTLNPAFNEFINIGQSEYKMLGTVIQVRINFKKI